MRAVIAVELESLRSLASPKDWAVLNSFICKFEQIKTEMEELELGIKELRKLRRWKVEDEPSWVLKQKEMNYPIQYEPRASRPLDAQSPYLSLSPLQIQPKNIHLLIIIIQTPNPFNIYYI